MFKVFSFVSMFILLSGGLEGLFVEEKKEGENIKYQNELTLDFPVAKINNKVIYDDIEKKNVTLYQYISDKGFPVYYSRNVQTGVCYDNQCKLLNITLYWNPTGRYLGFELAENEFLSKDDHVPFTEEEYIRLNMLLSDPKLPLGGFTYNQIAAKNKAALYRVDGVSGATSKDVLEYVIKGSAYTTYTIYELVYGSTQTEVQAWTDQVLTDEFLEDILTESPYQDKLWGIDLIQGRLAYFPQCRYIILDLMGDEDFSLAEKCLNSLTAEDLMEEEVQIELMRKFQNFDFGMKSRALSLLKNSNFISLEVVDKLNDDLEKMEVPIVSGILDIYTKKGIKDSKTIAAVRKISDSENRYLAKKADDYMKMLNQ